MRARLRVAPRQRSGSRARSPGAAPVPRRVELDLVDRGCRSGRGCAGTGSLRSARSECSSASALPASSPVSRRRSTPQPPPSRSSASRAGGRPRRRCTARAAAPGSGRRACPSERSPSGREPTGAPRQPPLGLRGRPSRPGQVSPRTQARNRIADAARHRRPARARRGGPGGDVRSSSQTTLSSTLRDRDGDNRLERGPGIDGWCGGHRACAAGRQAPPPAVHVGQLTDFQTTDEESPLRGEYTDAFGSPFQDFYRTNQGLRRRSRMVAACERRGARSRSGEHSS